jgi:hypothetical protein
MRVQMKLLVKAGETYSERADVVEVGIGFNPTTTLKSDTIMHIHPQKPLYNLLNKLGPIIKKDSVIELCLGISALLLVA